MEAQHSVMNESLGSSQFKHSLAIKKGLITTIQLAKGLHCSYEITLNSSFHTYETKCEVFHELKSGKLFGKMSVVDFSFDLNSRRHFKIFHVRNVSLNKLIRTVIFNLIS